MIVDNTSGPAITVWSKARASAGVGMCVEVARWRDGIALRDSKDPDGSVFFYTRDEFAAFLDGAKRGEFDHLI